MTQKEELRILRELLWKIGNSAMGYKTEQLKAIIAEVQYGYCYGQSNSNEGQTLKEKERLRTESLEKLDLI